MFDNILYVSVGPDIKGLGRISQDKASTVYFLREATGTMRITIRHSSYVDKKTKVTMDRHGIEFINTRFGTAPAPNQVHKTYAVVEVPENANPVTAVNTVVALSAFLTADNSAKLVNWES